MSKKSSGGGSSASQDALMRMAEAEYARTAPLRSQFEREYQNMRRGTFPTMMNTIYAGLRRPVEEQYDVARQNVLSTMPAGGRMFEALSDVETARAAGLQDILTQLYMDRINKIYGAAYQAPQVAISGLGTAAGTSAQRYGSNAAAGVGYAGAASNLGGSICCFNFLEAEGEIYPTVRMYRDAHYLDFSRVARGYRKTAAMLVPMMRRSKIWKQLVRILMTRPLKAYSQWYYGESRWGFLFWPFKAIWVSAWGIIGGD